MTETKIPQTDSIEELAQFGQAHDLTDFEDELEENTETVFVRRDKMENKDAKNKEVKRNL